MGLKAGLQALQKTGNAVVCHASAVAKTLAKQGSIMDDILNFDEQILDSLILTQAKKGKGIFKGRTIPCTTRELDALETTLSSNRLRKGKIMKLASKYQTESKVLKCNGQDVEFTIFKGSKSGSNPGYWGTIKGTDELYYIKYGDEAHIRSELLAGNLYELGGVPSTKKMLVSYKVPPKDMFSKETVQYGLATEFMPIKSLPTVEQAKIVREGFGLDCWLANWDALKDGNVVMSGGNAARLDVGGSLCYRARGSRKGVAFGENVNELTTFFESYSHSKPYISEMTRDELISSLERVSSISDEAIIKTIENAKSYVKRYNSVKHKDYYKNIGIKNPEFLQGTLISRRNYITRFNELCKRTPQKPNESMEAYIRRIDALVAKTHYDVNFETIQMSTKITDELKGVMMAERLSPTQKKIYEDSYHAYLMSGKNVPIGTNTGNLLTTDSMLHSTSHRSLEEILKDGITSGDLRGSIGTGTGCATQTPLCADFWDVVAPTRIKEYFTRDTYNTGEMNFLPSLGKIRANENSMVFVVNKKRVAPTLMNNSFMVSKMNSPLYKDNNMAGHWDYVTHRAIPIGVPANSIEKILINRACCSDNAIQQIKDLISKYGRKIELYDLDGNLL